MVNLSTTKVATIYNREMKVSTSDVSKTGQIHAKKQNWTELIPHAKIKKLD